MGRRRVVYETRWMELHCRLSIRPVQRDRTPRIKICREPAYPRERKAFEAGSSLALLSRPETNVFSLLAEAGKHGPLKERHRRPAAIDDAVFDCDDLDDNTRGPVGAVFPVTM